MIEKSKRYWKIKLNALPSFFIPTGRLPRDASQCTMGAMSPIRDSRIGWGWPCKAGKRCLNKDMTSNHRKPDNSPPGYKYQSPNIPMAAIRRFAHQIGLRFKPDKIILFGSYAYGRPREESDVDLLVI